MIAFRSVRVSSPAFPRFSIQAFRFRFCRRAKRCESSCRHHVINIYDRIVVTDLALRPEALVVARYWAPFKARLSTIWKCMSGAVRGGPSLDHSGVPAGGLGSYETGRMPVGLPTGLLPGALGST